MKNYMSIKSGDKEVIPLFLDPIELQNTLKEKQMKI